MTIIKHTLWTLLALGAVLFAACSDEEPVDFNAAMQSAPGLYVNLTISGDKVVFPTTKQTRAYTNNGTEVDTLIVGEEDLDENTVYNVDFFLFDTNGDLKTDGHVALSSTTSTGPTSDTNKDGITGQFFHSGTASLLFGSKWENSNNEIIGVTEGDMLYALVNMNWEEASVTAASINSLSDLKALTYAVDTIYMKRPDAQTEQSTRPSKPFLMDGSLKFTSELISTFNVNEVNEVTVDVKRAAAKIRVNIYKNDANNWAGYNATLGTITGSLMNYASVTRAVREGEQLEKDARGLLSVSHNSPKGITTYEISGKKTTATTGDVYVGSMLFYTFANEWESENSAETWLELNIPYKNKDDNGNVTANRPDNYYKIVFLPNDGKQLNRNTFYEVDIKVKNDGAMVSEEPETITDAKWTIEEWNTKDVNVIKNPTVDYLILSDYILDVRDEDNATITFYSSNPVTVEVIDLYKEETDNQVSLADIQGTEIEEFIPRYLGRTRSDDLVAVPGVYYVNKENLRIDIRNDRKAGNKEVKVESYLSNNAAPTPTDEEVLISWPEDQTKEGPINIYSKVPLNVSKRYITLRVTMPKSDGSGNLVKYAVVEQYPLEYIVINEGLYSYADGDVLYGNNLYEVKEYIYGFPSSKQVASWLDDEWQEWVTVPDSILYGTVNGEDHPGLGEEWTDTEKGQTFPGRIPFSPSMKPKFFISDKKWTDAEGVHEGYIYQVDDKYNSNGKDETSNLDNDGNVGLVPNKNAHNNSMYEVTISATSTKYTLSYPAVLTDKNQRMYAEESEANNNLLAPRFALASQLGNNSATPYWESAQDLCKHYVEVSRDGQFYDNWRLPTLAELQIIKNYQQSEHVYDITMNKVLNADGDTNPFYWTAGKYWYVNTTGAGGGEKQRFTQFKYEDPAEPFLTADNWKLEFDWGASAIQWNECEEDNATYNSYFKILDTNDETMFYVRIYPKQNVQPTIHSSSGEIILEKSTSFTINEYENKDDLVRIWYKFTLEGNNNQVTLSVANSSGETILSNEVVCTTFKNASKIQVQLGYQLVQIGLDNLSFYVNESLVKQIKYGCPNFINDWTRETFMSTQLYDRSDNGKYLNIKHYYGDKKNSRSAVFDFSSLLNSISEAEYFHISNPVDGTPLKVQLPYATDIRYYQDEDEDGVADVGSDGKKIILTPDANGLVNKRVLMTTYSATNGDPVAQRLILTLDKNNNITEGIGNIDYPSDGMNSIFRRVRCVRDIKETSGTE